MDTIAKLKEKVLSNEKITKEEALLLYKEPLLPLKQAASDIRKHFCQNGFDLCTIINGKSGKCSEDCKFCAQSAYYPSGAKNYPLMNKKEMVRQAIYNDRSGVLRYSIVTSGRMLPDEEVDAVCECVHDIVKQTRLSVCVSLGLLHADQFKRLKKAGVKRIHNNLETSRACFPHVCTTHTYEDKIAAIKAAQSAGLTVCSGGIMGLGETEEDRIDMAVTLRKLHIRSIPINMLNPIEKTPYEHKEPLTMHDMCRIIAVYRFLLPKASIRLAGGRGLLPDKGQSCFSSGANAAITGDMLTTHGISIETDKKMIQKLGYKVVLLNE